MKIYIWRMLTGTQYLKIIVKSEITLFGRNEDKQKRKATKMLAQ